MASSDMCYLHTRRPATLSCDLCARPICNDCVRDSDTRLTCPACLDDARRKGAAGRLGVIAAAALVIGALGVGGWMMLGSDEPDAPTAGSTKRYAEARLAAQREPNDPRRWLRVAEILLEEDKTALAREPLERAVELAPDDPLMHARLGFYHYQVGRDAEARLSLEKASLLGSDDPNVAATLDAIEARVAGEAEDIAARRARMLADQEAAVRAEVAAKVALAEAREASARAAAEEAKRSAETHAAEAAEAARRRFEAEGCSLPLERRGNSFLVPVTLGGAPARLIFDTGASNLLLSREIALRAGVVIDPEAVAWSQTANGRAQRDVGRLPRLEVAGGVLTDVSATVCRAGDACLGGQVDGLLGIEVQRALGMTLDAAAGRVRFAACE